MYYDYEKGEMCFATEERLIEGVRDNTEKRDFNQQAIDKISAQEDAVQAERGRLVKEREKAGTLTEEEIVIGQICGELSDIPEDTLLKIREIDIRIGDCVRALAFLEKKKQPYLEGRRVAVGEIENWQRELDFVVARKQFFKHAAFGTMNEKTRREFLTAAKAVDMGHVAYDIMKGIL